MTGLKMSEKTANVNPPPPKRNIKQGKQGGRESLKPL